MVNNDFTFLFYDRVYKVLVGMTCLFHKRSAILTFSSCDVCISSASVVKEDGGSCFEVPYDCLFAFKLND